MSRIHGIGGGLFLQLRLAVVDLTDRLAGLNHRAFFDRQMNDYARFLGGQLDAIGYANVGSRDNGVRTCAGR